MVGQVIPAALREGHRLFWSRFSSIFSGFIIAAFLASYGVSGVFAFIAAAMLLVFAIVGFWGPKTSGLRLEAIAR